MPVTVSMVSWNKSNGWIQLRGSCSYSWSGVNEPKLDSNANLKTRSSPNSPQKLRSSQNFPLCYQPWSTSLLCYSLGWIRFPSASSAVLILFSLFFPAKLMKWFRIHAGIRCFLTQVCSHQQPSRSLGWTPLCSDAFVSVLYSGWCPWLFWKGPLSKMMFIINNVNATKAH